MVAILPSISQLQADELVVYSPHQQRMRYLVEFTVPDEDGALREEVGESIEPGTDTTMPKEDNEELQSEDSEGMEMFAWEGRVSVCWCIVTDLENVV